MLIGLLLIFGWLLTTQSRDVAVNTIGVILLVIGGMGIIAELVDAIK